MQNPLSAGVQLSPIDRLDGAMAGLPPPLGSASDDTTSHLCLYKTFTYRKWNVKSMKQYQHRHPASVNSKWSFKSQTFV